MVCLMCITYFLYNHLSEKFSPNQSQRPHYTKYPADPKVYFCFINKLGSSTHLDFCAGFSSADCRVTRNTLRHRICCLFSCRATHRRVDSQQQHTGVARAATQPPPTTTTTTPTRRTHRDPSPRAPHAFIQPHRRRDALLYFIYRRRRHCNRDRRYRDNEAKRVMTQDHNHKIRGILLNNTTQHTNL